MNETVFDLAQPLEAGLDRAAIRTAFAEGPDAAARLLRDLADRRRPLALPSETPPRPPTIVLPIDQGEALLAGPPGDEGSTLDTLSRLLAAEVDLIGVMTIRSDRYGAMQQVEGLAGVNKIPFDLSPMVGGAYSRVITGPAKCCAGLSIEPALTEALLRDIDGGGGPEALPLLAFTLERLHRDHAAGGALRLEHYRAMGGLGGAIEAALRTAVERGLETGALPPDPATRVALLRRVMIPRLASVAGGDRNPERRVARYEDFEPDLRPVVDLLVDQRLLAKSTAADGSIVVEAGHESLLRLWGDLRRWLIEDARALQTLDGVRRATAEWRENDRAEVFLAHRGARLEDARALLERADFERALDADDLLYISECGLLFEATVERRVEKGLSLRENRRASRAIGIAVAIGLSAAAAADFAPLVTARELAFDAFQQSAPRAYDPTMPVQIVAIDTETLQRFGQWPWPRTYLATLIDRLVELSAAAVAFDILLADPDPLSAEVVDVRTRQFLGDGPPAASAVARTDNDAILADQIARAPVILGALPIAHDRAAGAEDQTLVVRWDAPRAPAADGACARKFGVATTGDGAAQSVLRSFDAAVCPLDMLANAAAGIGLLGTERSVGEVVRKVDLFSTVAGDVTPSLAMEALRVAQGVNTYGVRSLASSGETGLSAAVATTDSVRVGAVTVPIEPDGSLRVHFAGPKPGRSVPAWLVLERGDADDPGLAGLNASIVIVGAAAPGMGGTVATPVSDFTTTAEVQAEALETIIGGAWLTRPDWARGVEVIATLGAGLVVSLLAGAFAAGAVLLLAGLGAAAAFAASFWTFSSVGLLLDPIPVALAILAPATLAALLAARRAVAGFVGRWSGGAASGAS